MLPFKMCRPTRRHYFLRVNFRPFSFFTRTTRAKINPANDNRRMFPISNMLSMIYCDILTRGLRYIEYKSECTMILSTILTARLKSLTTTKMLY